MNAKISSVLLIQNENGVYWKIILEDELGNYIGTFGSDEFSSDIDFRNQTFYLMKLLNNWDLLNLDGKKKAFPVLVDNEFYRIKCLANSRGECLIFDYVTGEVLSDKVCDISNFCKKEISSLVSQSGMMMASVTDKYSHRAVSGDMAYLGFSPIYPIYATEEREQYGASCFRKFVSGILNLCDVKELIQSDNHPEVSIKFDENGNVIAIGNKDGSEYLYITDNGYEFCEEKVKKR